MTAVTRKRGDVRDVSMAARCAFAFVVVVRCTYGLRCCWLYLTQVNSTTRLVALINDNPLNHVRAMDNESIRPYPKRERPSTILHSYFERIVGLILLVRVVDLSRKWSIDFYMVWAIRFQENPLNFYRTWSITAPHSYGRNGQYQMPLTWLTCDVYVISCYSEKAHTKFNAQHIEGDRTNTAEPNCNKNKPATEEKSQK